MAGIERRLVVYTYDFVKTQIMEKVGDYPIESIDSVHNIAYQQASRWCEDEMPNRRSVGLIWEFQGESDFGTIVTVEELVLSPKQKLIETVKEAIDYNDYTECEDCGYYGHDFKENPKKFSVLLLYPDYMSDNFGQETYFEHTMAKDRDEAIQNIQAMAIKANPDTLERGEDMFPLAVFEGHIELL